MTLRSRLREMAERWRLRGRDLRESFLTDDALRVEECRAELLSSLSAPDETELALRGLVEALRTIATKEVWASRMKAIAQEAIAAATGGGDREEPCSQ